MHHELLLAFEAISRLSGERSPDRSGASTTSPRKARPRRRLLRALRRTPAPREKMVADRWKLCTEND